MSAVRLPLTVDDFVRRLMARGLIPSDALVRKITIEAVPHESHVTMTVEVLPDDRLVEAVT